MVVIRLARGGSKKRPFYRIVVADQRAKRDGKFIEKIGFYNPLARGQEMSLSLDHESYASWMQKGAQPSDRVASLFKLSAKNDHQPVPARFAKTSKLVNEAVARPAPKAEVKPEAEEATETEGEAQQ